MTRETLERANELKQKIFYNKSRLEKVEVLLLKKGDLDLTVYNSGVGLMGDIELPFRYLKLALYSYKEELESKIEQLEKEIAEL